MKNLPLYINLVFIATSLLSVIFFYKATKYSKKALLLILVWMVLHTILGLSGFYTVTDTMPPRFALLLPPLLCGSISVICTPGFHPAITKEKKLTVLHSPFNLQ